MSEPQPPPPPPPPPPSSVTVEPTPTTPENMETDSGNQAPTVPTETTEPQRDRMIQLLEERILSLEAQMEAKNRELEDERNLIRCLGKLLVDSEGKNHQHQEKESDSELREGTGEAIGEEDVSFPPDDYEGEDVEDEEQVPSTSRQGNGYGGRRNGPPCLLCGHKGHWATDCQAFGTMDSRKRQLRLLKKCSRCTWNIHTGNCFHGTPDCFYCRKAGRMEDARTHHGIICPYRWF